MGLSRRQFTKEFKLAAVRRLEMGASIAEVALAFEVNPNVLHRWRRVEQSLVRVSGTNPRSLGTASQVRESAL